MLDIAVVSPLFENQFDEVILPHFRSYFVLAARKISKRYATMCSGKRLKHSAVRPSGPPFLFGFIFRILHVGAFKGLLLFYG